MFFKEITYKYVLSKISTFSFFAKFQSKFIFISRMDSVTFKSE
jgi:hypothetical protein